MFYLVATLLSALWTLGDFPTVYFVSSGAPARTTDVLATYGFHQLINFGHPELGAAAMIVGFGRSSSRHYPLDPAPAQDWLQL